MFGRSIIAILAGVCLGSAVVFAAQTDLNTVLKTNAAAGISGDTTAQVTGGQDAASAYSFLCTISDKPCTPNITKLNPKFATCLAAMIKAGKAVGHTIRIVSAYRTPQEQAGLKSSAEAAGRGNMVGSANGSNHVKGLAVDLGAGSGMKGFYYTPAGKWTHANARRFGLYFRLMNPSLFEPWHIEPSGGDCNNGQTADSFKDGFMGALQGGQGGNGFGGTGLGGQSPLDQVNAANRQAEAQAAGQQAAGGGSGGAQQGGGLNAGGAANGPGAAGVGQTPGTAVDGQPVDALVLPMQNTQASCSPEQVHLGEAATITWGCPSGALPRITTQRGTRLVLPSGASATGSLTTLPPATTHYTISCVRSTQVVAQNTCDVTVLPKEASTTALTLTTSEEEVRRGETVDISWAAKNVVAGSCTLTGPNEFEASGSKGVTESDPLTDAENTFTLSCTSLAKKPVQESVTVRVVRNPVRSSSGSAGASVDQNSDL